MSQQVSGAVEIILSDLGGDTPDTEFRLNQALCGLFSSHAPPQRVALSNTSPGLRLLLEVPVTSLLNFPVQMMILSLPGSVLKERTMLLSYISLGPSGG